jgi:hypothetical protein
LARLCREFRLDSGTHWHSLVRRRA